MNRHDMDRWKAEGESKGVSVQGLHQGTVGISSQDSSEAKQFISF